MGNEANIEEELFKLAFAWERQQDGAIAMTFDEPELTNYIRQYAARELEKVRMQANVSGYSSGMYDLLDEKVRKAHFEASKQRQEGNNHWIDQAISRLRGEQKGEK